MNEVGLIADARIHALVWYANITDLSCLLRLNEGLLHPDPSFSSLRRTVDEVQIDVVWNGLD